MTLKKSFTAAVIFTAAFITLIGCATKRDVMVVDEKIQRVQADQKEVIAAVERIDAILTEDQEASTQLRAEIRSSVRDLLTEFRAMQTNIADLQAKVDYLSERGQFQTGYIPPVTLPTTDTTAKSDSVQVIPAVDCQELYDESFILLRRGQYEEAVTSFNEYMNYCGTSEKGDDARFWIGESYFSMKKFNEAISEFDLLLKNFPDSEKRPGAIYKMARSHEELSHISDAKQNYEKLVNDFPGTLEGNQAAEKLKEFQ